MRKAFFDRLYEVVLIEKNFATQNPEDQPAFIPAKLQMLQQFDNWAHGEVPKSNGYQKLVFDETSRKYMMEDADLGLNKDQLNLMYNEMIADYVASQPGNQNH
jgi:hypothetical protein